MKRINSLFNEIASLGNIKHAHDRAKRGKGHYDEVAMVENNPDKYFKIIQDLLINKTFKNSEYTIIFKQDGSKEREIWKLPYFPDRIIHHCIVNVLEQFWIRSFIRDTYSSIPGRGIHDGVRRIKKALIDTENTKYCLKLDVRKFYKSIDHDVLKSIINRKVKCTDTLWLIHEIIDSAEGVPIGNYVSQYFANIYLSGLDHYIKEDLKIKYYFRYCDDMVILKGNKEELHDLRIIIEDYLSKRLKLDLKANWQVFPVDVRGIDFLGYRFFPTYTLVRKSIVKRFKQKHASPKSASSYNGWFVWANTHNLKLKYDCLQ